MKIIKQLFLSSLFLILFSSCNQHNNPLAYQTDTHGRGEATVLIEESFKRLFDTSIYTFESQFPKAKIIPKYMTEDNIIKSFYNNEAKTIVISRELNPEELKFLKSKKVEVRSDKVAVDAIAIILHPSNLDTLLTIDELKQILVGNQKTWKNSNNEIKIVYDNVNSANYNYLQSFCGKDLNSKNVFALKSNEEVINYIKKTPNAMGIIGLNWISDQDDFDVKDFLDGIKVVALSKNKKSKFFQPYSGFMYTKEYPLTRDIWMINKGRKSGLNTGFVLFMISEIGQTIVNQSALVPANAPVRLIQFKEE
jgi:phosphate transport system substrate-binding protein